MQLNKVPNQASNKAQNQVLTEASNQVLTEASNQVPTEVLTEEQLFKKRLFEPALNAFKPIMYKKLPEGQALESTSLLNMTPNKGVPPFKDPIFDEWYKGIKKDIYPKGVLDKTRLNKLEQYGSLTFPQPTGGFLVKKPMNKEAILQQYKKALGYTGSVLMVITEPFTQEFVNDADPNHFYQYFENQNIGLYYTRQFQSSYAILPNTIRQNSITRLYYR